MPQIPEKLAEIRKTTIRQHRKRLRRVRLANGLLVAMLALVALVGYYNGLKTPIPEAAPIFQAASVVIVVLFLMALVLTIKAGSISFEKQVFLRILDAYDYIKTYNALSGSKSQKESNIEEAEKLLRRVSQRLQDAGKIITSFELTKETHSKYARLGEAIQAKILFRVRNRKDLPIVEKETLNLAESLAEASTARLDLSIASLESIQGGEEFKPKALFLKSEPRLYSLLRHTFRLVVSALVVVGFAAILATAFSKPLSDFAVYVLVPIFTLFAAWEFKSPKQ